MAVGREVVWDQGDGWQWQAVIRVSRGIRYLMCSYGPAADGPKSMRDAVKSLAEAAIRQNADFIRLEPQSNITAAELEAMGARRIGEVQPAHTQVVDLILPIEEIRGELASGHRNLINGTQRRGITVRKSTAAADFEAFITMLRETQQHARTTFHSEEYYRKLWQVLQPKGICQLYVADVNGESVAAAMFYDWGSIRYYAHAGARQEANRRAKASVSLVWQALVDAKEAKMAAFDLWGVSPEGDESHKLAALSRFKRAFGGQTVAYLGTWDIPLKTNKYRAYTWYRRLRGRK